MQLWQAEFDDSKKPIRTSRFTGKGHIEGHTRGWNIKEFIAWDGEGIKINEPIDVGNNFYHWEGSKEVFHDWLPEAQPYVLLANSKLERITREEGLKTVECFEFLLNAKQRYPLSIFVGFALNYDINQMLKDVPRPKLWKLSETNYAVIGNYYIKWFPRKSLFIKHRPTKRSVTLYDVFGYFQKSFLETCKEYLGEDDPQLSLIEAGKIARDAFNWHELDTFIIPYNDAELEMTVRIMNILRQNLHDVGIDPALWFGPGAVASKVFGVHKIPITRDEPEEVLDAAQFAYAGGRFEPFYLGRHPDIVWEYDIRSAYPEATTYLPDISAGHWEFVERYEPGTFGIWNVDYRANGSQYPISQPQPLFCRSEIGTISYPYEVQGWYWTPEADLVSDSVKGGWVFREDTNARPFAFVKEMYEQRRLLKLQGDPSQRALKLILNSLYGKTAQTIGYSKDEPPRWHQLEYAGFITSYTRAKIFNAIQLNPSAIIATETDAVFSREPLDLPLSTQLGDWEESVFDEITYIQSGFYYALTKGEIVSKYRGMDRDRETKQPVGLPYRYVVDHLCHATGRPGVRAKALLSHTTRFIGLGLGLRTRAIWRSWEKKSKIISLDARPGYGKRMHVSTKCPMCNAGISMGHALHPTQIRGYSGKSYARSLPWRNIGGEAPIEWAEWVEMNSEMKDLTDYYDKFQ